MNITQILFWFLSALAVGSALLVVTRKNPVYSVLFLIVTFFAISGHYILMNAQFLAIVNIIVYAGAIMVLFLFVLMLMNLNAETEPQKNKYMLWSGAIAVPASKVNPNAFCRIMGKLPQPTLLEVDRYVENPGTAEKFFSHHS